ncbi:S49 family peptidase [Haloplanus aerogenes]|uniref:Protease-4 n=2 Tax=Haloplanus aerogenes TaxID=660522 RepID=A0A3M0DRB2_9EURY|nr:S49 family peptidase [Haloplanus aerogenes]AZH24394.1 S49 family peptidase [Haloplanus aerogenes]RMB23965.1 protease-4 [Haloplanus aerogenes]
MSDDSDGASLSRAQSYALVVAAAILLSAVLAPVAYDRATAPDGRVAVISVEGFISSSSVTAVQEDLREARENESIDAVVLNVDSPGGSAAASEQLYLAVQRTAQVMPVVASVKSTGASGAYYAMLPARDIYVTPASIVGSVGVRGAAPGPSLPGEIKSGPDKASTTADQRRAQIETLQRAFVGSVMKHRGDELGLSRTEVAHAKVYTGASAVDNGMADQIGSTPEAIDAAAEAADLEDYEVVRKEPPRAGGLILLSTDDGGTVVVEKSPAGYDAVDTPTFLMVYGEVQTTDEVIGNVSA